MYLPSGTCSTNKTSSSTSPDVLSPPQNNDRQKQSSSLYCSSSIPAVATRSEHATRTFKNMSGEMSSTIVGKQKNPVTTSSDRTKLETMDCHQGKGTATHRRRKEKETERRRRRNRETKGNGEDQKAVERRKRGEGIRKRVHKKKEPRSQRDVRPQEVNASKAASPKEGPRQATPAWRLLSLPDTKTQKCLQQLSLWRQCRSKIQNAKNIYLSDATGHPCGI